MPMEMKPRMLNLWRRRSIRDVRNVALALRKGDRPGERHLAIVYVNHEFGGRRPRWLHLAWHHEVSEEDLGDNYAWGEPALHPDLGFVLSQICRRIAARYVDDPEGIRYALRYVGGEFDEETGEYVCGDGVGLTCATFVMAVFASTGVKLLNREEWTLRPEDAVWQARIVEALKRHGAADAHVQVVKSEVGNCPRFRPEEVAVAGVASKLPLGFKEAEARGTEILQWLTDQVAEGAAEGME